MSAVMEDVGRGAGHIHPMRTTPQLLAKLKLLLFANVGFGEVRHVSVVSKLSSQQRDREVQSHPRRFVADMVHAL